MFLIVLFLQILTDGCEIQLGCNRYSVDRRVKLRYNCCAISLLFYQPPEFDGESDLTTTTGSTLIYNKILFMC